MRILRRLSKLTDSRFVKQSKEIEAEKSANYRKVDNQLCRKLLTKIEKDKQKCKTGSVILFFFLPLRVLIKWVKFQFLKFQIIYINAGASKGFSLLNKIDETERYSHHVPALILKGTTSFIN